MSTLSAFNTQLTNLSNNLSESYPNDPDLQFSSTTINFLKSTNPRKLQEIFNKYIYIYKDEIMNQDENFLLNNDFINNTVNNDNVDYAISIMNNLKKYWNDMDNESKDNIWKYFKVLVILNTKCIEESK
tara:strand:+ start:5585 stop:5971 length:387 start_codon:yes stop_codon:yes gene_type:complete